MFKYILYVNGYYVNNFYGSKGLKMSLLSLNFFIFLIPTVIAYHLVSDKLKNIFLVTANFCFYALYDIKTVPFLLLNNLDIPLLDYNSDELYYSLELCEDSDYSNYGHLNIHGASKFTRKLAKDLIDNGYIAKENQSDAVSQFWDKKVSRWEREKSRGLLKCSATIEDYLTNLNNSDYILCIVSQGSFDFPLPKEIYIRFKNLGCLSPDDFQYGAAWTAVVNNGETVYSSIEVTDEPVTYNYTYNNTDFRLISGSNPLVKKSIVIDDTEYAAPGEGINFTVYSVSRQKVIDSINFDINNSCTASRV